VDDHARFCIRSVTPEERRALESVRVRPHDCIGACTDCFHGPVIARADERLEEREVRDLLAQGRAARREEPGPT